MASSRPTGNVKNIIASRQRRRRQRQPLRQQLPQISSRTKAAGTVKNVQTIARIFPSTNGATTAPAKKPKTTLGKLAIISTAGLILARRAGRMNSLVYKAAPKASGTPNNSE